MLHQAFFFCFFAMCIFCKMYFNIYFSFLRVKTTTKTFTLMTQKSNTYKNSYIEYNKLGFKRLSQNESAE